jgi:hypothetical protein
MMTKPVETAETLMRDATEGRLPKQALAALLVLQPRQTFLTSCADIEKAHIERLLDERRSVPRIGMLVRGRNVSGADAARRRRILIAPADPISRRCLR